MLGPGKVFGYATPRHNRLVGWLVKVSKSHLV